MFDVAKLLRGVDGLDPLRQEDMIVGFCTEAGIEPDYGWAKFLAVWDEIANPDGNGAWEAAVKFAMNPGSRVLMAPDPGRLLLPYALVGYYLSGLAEIFPFPVGKLAESFGKSEQTASMAVRALAKFGVIEWADASYSYAEKRARTARFIAEVNVG